MAALLVKEKISDLAFVLQKISNTVTVHTERYPEVMYVSAGLKSIKQQSGEPDNVDHLIALNKYLKDKLTEYNVIKLMQHRFQQDVEALVAGTEVNREGEIYLDFLKF